jgi:hypothetical protein
VSDLTALPSDVSNVATAATGLINGALADAATADSGGAAATVSSLLNGGAGAAIAPVTDSPLLNVTANPIANTLNATVLDLHSSIETFGDQSGIIGTTHGLTNLGETIGLGKLGDDNALTHVLDAPSDILAGNLGDVIALPGDVANVATAATGLVDGVASDAANLVNGGAVSNVASGVDGLLGHVADAAGLPNTGAVLSGLGTNGIGGLVSDVQHLAGDALSDVPVVTSAVSSLSTALGTDLGSHATALPTLASLFGTGSEPGAHDAVDASVGPAGSGGTINLLGTPVTDGHSLDVHALALPAAAPAGIAVAALGDGGLLHFGSTGGGSDALSGVIQQVTSTAHVETAPVAAAATPAPELPIDLHAIAGLDHALAHHA